MKAQLLAPWPQQVEPLDSVLALPEDFRYCCDTDPGEFAPALERLGQVLNARGISCQRCGPSVSQLEISIRPEGQPAQGYTLTVSPDGAEVIAADAAGAFYAIHTLAQWIGLHDSGTRVASGVRIVDWPTLPHRGVLLDISRNRVPTLETLFQLVDQLAGWKINQLQLYTEHTFAYQGHEVVWQDASPMTAEEIQALDDYCVARHIELVPNQNSFGHLHRWLSHAEYRELAECPEGLEHPFGGQVEPFSLCPTDPGSLELLAGLYDQLLPNFRSRQFNVGFDETFDLGKGRSAGPVDSEGVGPVYLRFLEQVRQLAGERGRRIQYWGDIVASHPELLDELPKDALLLSWGYEAEHDFEKELAPLGKQGLSFYVCPGTSSWLSFGGRTTNALGNITEAIRAGVAHGATGCLITDWGDRGHLQPLPVSLPGFLAAAACSWNDAAVGDPENLPLEGWLTQHAFEGRSGQVRALLALGELYAKPGARAFNGSPLFHLVVDPDLSWEHPRVAGAHLEGFAACRAEIVQAREQLQVETQDLISRELTWVCDALELGADIGSARLSEQAPHNLTAVPVETRESLAGRLARLLAQLETLWLERSRPGGLPDSQALLERAMVVLETGGIDAASER
jgi:hypothetical protein